MRRIISFSIVAFSFAILTSTIFAQNTNQLKVQNQNKKQVKVQVGINGPQGRTNWVDLDGDGICDNYSSAARLRNMNAKGDKGMGLQNTGNSLGNGSGYRFGDGSGLHPQDGTGLGFKNGGGTGTGTGVCDGTGPKGNAKGRR